MRWKNAEGEYHAGTLEMMTSPSVIVAYLESEKPWYPVPGEKPWSNKKWRELFIVTPDFITGIKGYPYNSYSLEKIVFEKLAEMMKQNCGITFNTEDVCRQSDSAVAPSGATITFRTIAMYNDCDWNEIDTIFAKNCGISESNDFYYGEGAYCIRCGKLRDCDDDIEGFQDSLYCYNCAGRIRCSHCGNIISARVHAVDPEGNPICYSCYDNIRFDELIEDRWSFYDDDYTITLNIKRPSRTYARDLSVSYYTYDDLRRSGAATEVRRSFNLVLTHSIPDDPEFEYLAEALAAWEKIHNATILYDETIVEE